MPKLKYRLDGSPVNLTLPDGAVCEMQPGNLFEVPDLIKIPQPDGSPILKSFREVLLKTPDGLDDPRFEEVP